MSDLRRLSVAVEAEAFEDKLRDAALEWLERTEVIRDEHYLVTGDGVPLTVIAYLLVRELRREAA